MNILPALQPILEDLTERFGARIQAVQAPRPNEVYFHAQMELLPGFCAQLYKKWNARLVSLFADDARSLVGQASRLSGGRPALGHRSAGDAPAGSFEQRGEARLLEMLVAGQGLGDALVPHDNKRKAVRQRPVLVLPLLEEIYRPRR